jgi:uncharacterized protein (DUF924 family)
MLSAAAVLDFWFVETDAARWFRAEATFDAQIRARFDDAAAAAADGRLHAWAATPAGWLALLLLLDQFPRNLYRRDARAWAQDDKAQRLALSGLATACDQRLPPLQRVFAYLPLEHAEDPALQQRSVALFGQLCVEASPEQRKSYEDFFDYARRHREVIARFGRFPHRNRWLGRVSTPDERCYLARPDAGF